MLSQPQLIGCDFTSSPTRRKAIVVAQGEWLAKAQAPQLTPQLTLRLTRMARYTEFAAFAQWLAAPGAWVGGFDLPFGLPRELIVALGWPTDWLGCIRHFSTLSRAQIRETFAAYCAARPVGGKFAHRETDGPAGSSPSMKWVNPPVAYMLHAGVPLLLAAGLHLPGLHDGDRQRVALEAYPGWLARQLVGRDSYKSDDVARQTVGREQTRARIVQALGQPLAMLDDLHLQLEPAQQKLLVQDASGDSLDAVLCMLVAAWAHARWLAGDEHYGLPPQMDALEGWIAGVQRK